jgi:hypothetical protein
MKKALLILLSIVAVVGIAIVAALHYASRTVEDVVLKALGPESELGEVKVRLTDVELLDIAVGAPKGWPTDSALRARRVVLKPKLSQVFSDRIELTDVVIDDAYISAARPKEGGGLRVMPGLARKAKKDEKAQRGADIRVVHFKNCTIDLYDASVAVKPRRVRVEGVGGTVEDIEIPGLGARSEIDLTGVLPGPAHRGKISVRGWFDVRNKSSELTIQVRGADLALFEPYIVQKTKVGIDSGTFDLSLKANVRNNVLNAPGTLTIHSLKLQQAEGPLEALAEIPRRAAIGAVTDKEERITVEFRLQGDLDDPNFSLAGAGALKTGLALIKAFGLSFEGLIRAIYLLVNGFGASLGAALG